MSTCPFCKQDPYHYADVGVGSVPVAINCCDAGYGLSRNEKPARQALRFMQSNSPRKKARAMRILVEKYG